MSLKKYLGLERRKLPRHTAGVPVEFFVWDAAKKNSERWFIEERGDERSVRRPPARGKCNAWAPRHLTDNYQ